ncbi:hypothetical protein FDP22_16680 [Paroceanicella profunda]|uniref:NADH-ubiquinone dehydrogenase n=1 Tax=Paroceanicella profunda TaxID=2579971 RepID=A0A5B8G3E9_9RHOB|nr:hypothetical protein FDP22_16680 [Paroceanicella profunda]
MTLLPLFEPGRWAPKKDESPLEYWTSLSPAAPFFGVAWRFAADPKAAGPADAGVAEMSRAFTEQLSKSVKAVAEMTESLTAVAQTRMQTAAKAADAAEVVTAKSMQKSVESAAEIGGAVSDMAFKSVRAAAEVSDTVNTSTRRQVKQATDASEAMGERAQKSAGVAADYADEMVKMAKPSNLFSKAPAMFDDLKMIRGVGPKLERELNQMGIYSFDQISKFTEANLAWVDANLSAFKGRPFRDNWIEQAMSLMKH